MKKKIGIFLAMVIFIVIPLAVKAATESGYTDIKSYGSIIYKDSSGSVELYAEDIALLQEKLASMPEEIFDPILYSHSHKWEYVDITENTHKKHCSGCGSAYDLVNRHSAAMSRMCSISYDGEEYVGYERTCECGYQWKEEAYHNLIYISKNDTYHMLTCALAETEYCSGLAVREEEHFGTLFPTDTSHHQTICDYCGHQGEFSECIFDYESIEDSEDSTKVQKYCECGNYMTETKEPIPDPEIPDPEISEPEESETMSENHTEAVLEREGGTL